MENPQEYLSINQAGCRIGARVRVSGIVSEIQDHGGLLFIDIKDRCNLIKALIIPDNKYAYAMSQKLEKGFLVEIEGLVKECPTSAQNIESERKAIEIEVEKIGIISARDDEEYNRLIGILAKISAQDSARNASRSDADGEKKLKKKIV